MSIRYSLNDSGFVSSTDAEFFVLFNSPHPEELALEFDTEQEFWDWFIDSDSTPSPSSF